MSETRQSASSGVANQPAAAPKLQPFALKDAPALIEAVFPAQKVSFEAQRERKANMAQLLTALGSYWRGRKPLILVRAILLGSLLPRTDDPERDLEIFEQLMAFDEGGLARRQPKLRPADIAARVALAQPWRWFSYSLKGQVHTAEEIDQLQFPIDLADYPGLSLRWRRDIDPADKLDLLAQALATFPTYEERAGLCKRPEELDQTKLYAPIWPAVNAHLGRFGIDAHSHQEVVGAWYIATETSSELKKGGYVQGTVILMLRKRPAGDRPGFKQRILPTVKREVDAQIQQMLHLNTETEAKMGAPVFNDSDLQMAGYAAALKVLTGFTSIGGEDVTSFALRPRRKGETTVVDEIVEQAAETANGLLVPDGLEPETWAALSGIQRFYLRMLDMETTGAAKLDNYQNFAKAFRVADYAAIMASIKPNAARLKAVTEFKPRDLTDRTELGPTPLGALIVAIQEFLIGCGADKEPEVVMANLRDAVPDYLGLRPKLVDMTQFIAAKARQPETRRAAEAIASRMRNQRLQ